jgi:hypothetical protein
MIIKINEEYGIKTDRRQYMVCEWVVAGKDSRSPGKKTLEPFLFCTTLEHAVKCLLEYNIRNPEIEKLQDALESNRKLVGQIHKALEPYLDLEGT